MYNPLINIVVPVFNASNTLENSIRSIMNQSYKNLRIILVDDGSTDNSLELCLSLSKEDARIVVLHQENSGPAIARNTGLKYIEDGWVTFMDSDDYIGIDGYRKMIAAAGDAEMLLSGKVLESPSGSEVIAYDYCELFDSMPADLYLKLEKYNTRDYIWNRFYLSSIIKDNNIRFENVRIGEDTLFNIDYQKFISRVNIVDVEYYHYVQNSNSISRGYREDLNVLHNLMFTKLKQLNECKSNHSSHFLTYIHDVQMMQFFASISNVFYTFNDLSNQAKKSMLFEKLDEFQKLDFDLRKLVANQKINYFLFSFKLVNMIYLYNETVGFIKRLKFAMNK